MLSQPNDHHLAQLNIAHLSYPLSSPELKDFVDNLDIINRLAERSLGFVWRYVADNNTEEEIKLFGDNAIVNLSVWESPKTLNQFVYKTVHAQFVDRRTEWFKELDNHAVFWWIPSNTQPSLIDAADRLQALTTNGSSNHAFTLEEFQQCIIDD